jgi:dipeptidase D
MSKEVRELEPKAIWGNFCDLNAVPRASKKEEQVIQFMLEFGRKLGLETLNDKIGNVIIKKPASKGMEDRKTVILQSHLDMVHQKNNDTDFDFATQGIDMVIEDGWVTAKGTTLGADNGLGVATIMGLLASKDIDHPPLEAMFTVDEETGMTGAKELDPSFYEGEILLNLDTEDDDELSIGCAGGIDTNTSYKYEELYSLEDTQAFKVEIKGLKGGHSGMDINQGRANANKLMARLLTLATTDCMLHSFEGGGLRNAIPREAVAIVSLLRRHVDGFKEHVQEMNAIFSKEYDPVETGIKIVLTEVDTPDKMVAGDERLKMIHTINAVHNGVFKMSLKFNDLVETSSSLAQVSIKDGLFTTKSLQRSSVESTKTDVATTVRSPFDLLGAEVEQSGDYPGWEPNPDSPILKTMADIYRGRFNEDPAIKACHAGLECGILGKHLPEVDMISFGPTIRHAHSPDECASIESVEKFWGYLLEVLKNVPKK